MIFHLILPLRRSERKEAFAFCFYAHATQGRRAPEAAATFGTHVKRQTLQVLRHKDIFPVAAISAIRRAANPSPYGLIACAIFS